MNGIGGLQLLRERSKDGVIPGLFHSLEEILLIVAPYCKVDKIIRIGHQKSWEKLVYYHPLFPMKLADDNDKI